MSLTVAASAGFCPGVRRADVAVRRLLHDRQPQERIFTLGALIHNRIYTEKLRDLGVEVIDLAGVETFLSAHPDIPVTLVLRTHGVTKETRESLAALSVAYPGFRTVDMTCPFVARIQKIAAEKTGPGTAFVLFCDPGHPEAIGIMSYANGIKYAVSSAEEISRLDLQGKIPIFCSQTTQNLVEFKKIKKYFQKVYTNAIFFDTICSVTENRQNEALELASKSDRMFVIGGKDSSNTRRLYELCRSVCPDTRWVESAKELATDFPNTVHSTGITAGASTPVESITEVLREMEENFETLLNESLTSIHTGETVTGTVYAVTANEIKLDLPAKYTGVIEKDQITDDPNVKLSDMFKIDDEVQAFVIRVDDNKGTATLSKKRVDADKSWVLLKDAKDNDTVLEGVVTAAVKGGVTMSVGGNRVFIPASQTGIAKDGDMSVLVGTNQKIKLIDFDEQKRKAVGSIKVVANEEKKQKEDAVWATLEVGQHFDGVVKNLTPYGAFVDIGGVDGMIHNTELSWKRIKHPSQVVKVGQQVHVFIKELDPERRRISLGYKTQEMDSWFQFTQKYHVGDVVPAKIVSLMPFGAFAEVYPDVDGLIHISRISTQRINSPADVLSVGQTVDVKIIEIDDENRKLALSIRALTEEAEKAAAEEARAAERAARDAEEEEARRKEAEERADMAPYIVGSI